MPHRGLHRGDPGLYLNVRKGELIEHSGGLLPGSSKDRYVRVPLPFMVILGPLLGGLYVLVLPLVAVAGAVYILARWVYKGVLAVATALLYLLVVPTWMPGRSYLLGLRSRRRKTEESKEPATQDELENLSREIEEKLKGERRG